MNLLLFSAEELGDDGLLQLSDRRFRHLSRVLRSQPGDTLRVGAIDGSIGAGVVEHIDGSGARLRVTLQGPPPAPLPVVVVLALPRPKMLRRILRGLAEVGVKELHLINSYRVEKSFWQTPLLRDASLREALLHGLEQAGDTRLPAVRLQRRFRPFAEDLLPGLCGGREALLAQPGAADRYPAEPRHPATLVIGPEGGFIPFEDELICAAGARPVHLGERILRVETALQTALGRHLAAAP